MTVSSLFLLPLFHFHPPISLHFPFFPLILFSHPQCACYLGCVPYRPYGLWARGPGRGAAGTMGARGGTCEEVERHCSRCLTSGSAPLQLLDVFNSSLCLLSRHCGGTIKTTATGHNIRRKIWLRANKCMAWEMHSLIGILAVLEIVLIAYHHWLLLYFHIIKEYINTFIHTVEFNGFGLVCFFFFFYLERRLLYTPILHLLH